jgi:hypothetical protein
MHRMSAPSGEWHVVGSPSGSDDDSGHPLSLSGTDNGDSSKGPSRSLSGPAIHNDTGDAEQAYRVAHSNAGDNEQVSVLTNNMSIEQASMCRAVFNAPFYRSVGFCTKRAADGLMFSLSNIHDMYMCAIDDIMRVVKDKRGKVRAYLLAKHKQEIDAANAKDRKVSKDIKQAKMQRYIEQEMEEARVRRYIERVQAQHELERARVRVLERELHNARLHNLEHSLGCTNMLQDPSKPVDAACHFREIRSICESDPDNRVSVQVVSYMKQNGLV